MFHCIVNMMGGYPACLKFSFHHSMHIRRLLDHFLFEHGYFFPQVWRFVLTRTIDNSPKVDTLKNTAKRFDSAMELSTAGTETNFCSTSKENAQRILGRIQAVVPSSLWKVQFSFSSEKSKHSPTTKINHRNNFYTKLVQASFSWKESLSETERLHVRIRS